MMYHQSYGAHYLPAAAYKATYYNQQQQRKLSVYNKKQECMEQQSIGSRGMLPQNLHRQTAASGPIRRFPSDCDLKDSCQPAEAEYLSARCVLFTYFRGEIGDVVDEHFSRALSQASSFNGDSSKALRVTQPTGSTSAGAWKDGPSPIEPQSHSSWTTSSCPSQSTVPVHPDFSSSPVSFTPDGPLWTGHVFSPPTTATTALPESWTYNPQTSSSYPSVHDVYHSHGSSMHPRHPHHHHPMLHPYPAHSPTLDPRFSPLLLPGVRNQSQPSASSSPLSEGVKSELDASSPSTPISWAPTSAHGSLEMYDSSAYARMPQLSSTPRLLP